MLPILLSNLRFLKYEFPFLVLLRRLKSSFILPTQNFTTIGTIDIGNSVETSQEMPVFFWAYNNIHRVGEQKGSTISSLNKIMENNIGLKHLPTTPITEVKTITLTHTKFLAKQNLQFNSYIVKLQIFHRLKIFERSDKANIMKEGMQIKQNIVKKLKWWTWKALEIISSWRATWFRQLWQLYNLGPTNSAAINQLKNPLVPTYRSRI